MRFSVCVVLSFVVVCAFAKPLSDDTRFSHYPMISAHDSATGYLPGGFLHPINDYTKTQSKGFTSQLDCGARALDFRPWWDAKKQKLIFHHATVTVNTQVTDALDELKRWAQTHPSELILLDVSHCLGPGHQHSFQECYDEVAKVFRQQGVPLFDQGSCGMVSGLTVGEVKQRSKLASGGHIIAVIDCVRQNWQSDISCAGHEGNYVWSCMDSSFELASHAFSRLWSYATSITDNVPYQLSAVQLLWQETVGDIVDGIAHFSSLTDMERHSHINAEAINHLSSFKYVNLIMMNEVCDSGPALYAALMARHDTSAPDFAAQQAVTSTGSSISVVVVVVAAVALVACVVGVVAVARWRRDNPSASAAQQSSGALDGTEYQQCGDSGFMSSSTTSSSVQLLCSQSQVLEVPLVV